MPHEVDVKVKAIEVINQ